MKLKLEQIRDGFAEADPYIFDRTRIDDIIERIQSVDLSNSLPEDAKAKMLLAHEDIIIISVEDLTTLLKSVL